jgi:RNA polymerase sigma factor (sigma-70 family)
MWTMEREIRDAEMLLDAAGSDAAAFAAFYRLFERPVLGFFMRATARPELAADLTAETFARALESAHAFDPARGRADQWLFGIARNVLGSSYRAGRVESAARERLGLPRLVVDDHASDTIARLSDTEDRAARALACLPDEQQSAIEAHVVQGRGYAEIAGELRCSEAVVRQRVSRGLSTLRARLAGER